MDLKKFLKRLPALIFAVLKREFIPIVIGRVGGSEVKKIIGSLAQLVQSIPITIGRVGGSEVKKIIGSLAQLVQSICLTSRGSAVRSRQLPQRPRLQRGFFYQFYAAHTLLW